ncbi:hypothetical protein FQA39_LY01225 [Lamprigera yunnana]|nr:hypothetical protein FQA39_LY01225 [Lamprigera yunnana]
MGFGWTVDNSQFLKEMKEDGPPALGDRTVPDDDKRVKVITRELCEPEVPVNLDTMGEGSSITILLNPKNQKKTCKLNITAPASHVINLQWHEQNLELLESPAIDTNPCPLSVFLSEDSKNPVWKGNLCMKQSLPEIDLLTPNLKLVWSPPRFGIYTRGRKLVITAIGQDEVCIQKGQHVCMRIGWKPMLCISEQLVCDGNLNCPKGSTRSDEDEKLCKNHFLDHSSWKSIAEDVIKTLPADVLNTNWKSMDINAQLYNSQTNFLNWKDAKGHDVETEEPDHLNHHDTADSVSTAIGHYGTWGYLMLAMLIVGTILMFCGLWECCFRKPKPQVELQQQSPSTTVLIINRTQETSRPPNYDELEQPPSYITLFPNSKLETEVIANSDVTFATIINNTGEERAEIVYSEIVECQEFPPLGHCVDTCSWGSRELVADVEKSSFLPILMPQKNKKLKKKVIPKRKRNDFTKKEKSKGIENKLIKNTSLSSYFKNEELQQIKNVLKIKDLNNVPLVIASVALNKVEMLKQLIGEGCNVNEIGPSNTTALIWAIKFKNLEMVDILLPSGADGNGCNTLLLALENKIWDEKSFLKLWNHIRHYAYIDVDFMGKNGRNILHTTIRREWVEVLKLLISEKVNVNAPNSNKVTPLMLASYLNNYNMVTELLEADADVLKKDVKGNTALCYAIATVVSRNIETPHLVIDQLLTALNTQGIAFEDFLQAYIDVILSCPIKQKKSGQPKSDAKDYIIPYALAYREGSLKVLLEGNAFQKIFQAVEKHLDNLQQLTKHLAIINEILHSKDLNCKATRKLVLENFIADDGANICLKILKRYGCEPLYSDDFCTAFELLLFSTASISNGKQWLVNNYDEVFTTYTKFFAKNANDDNREKLMKFAELLNRVVSEEAVDENRQLTSEEQLEGELEMNETRKIKETKQDVKSVTKKTKRRSKTVKTKIVKIKSADLAERLNKSGKKILEKKCSSDTSIIKNMKSKKIEAKENKFEGKNMEWPRFSTWEQVWLMDSGNDPLIKEYSETMVMLEHKIAEDLSDELLDVETPNDPLGSIFADKNDSNNSTARLGFMNFREGTDINGDKEKTPGTDSNYMIQSSVNYLSTLLSKILKKYQNHWAEDDQRQSFSKTKTTSHPKSQSDQQKHIQTVVRKLEVEHILRVQFEFDSLIADINNSPNVSTIQRMKVLKQLENILLNHKVRGKSIIDGIQKDTVYVSGNSQNDLPMGLSNPQLKQPLVVKSQPSNHPDALYLEEMLSLPLAKDRNITQLFMAPEHTTKSLYHLYASLETLCNCDNDDASNMDKSDKEDNDYATSPSEETAEVGKKRPTLQENLLAVQNHDDDEKLSSDSKNSLNSEEDNFAQTPSRWCRIVKSLQMGQSYNILLNGDVRISNKDKEELHTISTGGNFSPVVLGLDSNNRPLAVKRIKAHTDVSKLMKNLINPLLGLRNANLLHYFTCNFEDNELIVATPLCEYNMGEYVMCMKQHSNMYIRSFDVVKQFLSGLRFLHDREDPIVHGNLKPSNIFLDLNGTVRIAEFGMHKALYTLVEAPNTSVIWFSRETLNTFKETACVTCTCASDIQVAGMLVHFILTAGKHPYGESMQDILRNLEKAMPQLITNNIDLHDLISWMLLYEPGERPTINQVLSHVFFWTSDRKWRFILACAGLSAYGTPLDISVQELFFYINLTAVKENIKGKWISITKKRFPLYKYSNADKDSIAGLLGFIRFCVQNEVAYCVHGNHEFRAYILQTFPALALSLYRILEPSQWLTHHVLQPFTTIDSLSV